jgi:hypothetical protein
MVRMCGSGAGAMSLFRKQPKLTSWLRKAADTARQPKAAGFRAAAEVPEAHGSGAAKDTADSASKFCSIDVDTELAKRTAGMHSPVVRDLPMPATLVGVACNPELVDAQQAAEVNAMTSRSAAAATASAEGAAAVSGRTSCAVVQLDAAKPQTALHRYLRHLRHAETPLVYHTRLSAANAEGDLPQEEQPGQLGTLQRSQQLLQQKCSKILNQAFTNNAMWDAGDITINSYAGELLTANIDITPCPNLLIDFHKMSFWHGTLATLTGHT